MNRIKAVYLTERSALLEVLALVEDRIIQKN